jgi:hypothetical protein
VFIVFLFFEFISIPVHLPLLILYLHSYFISPTINPIIFIVCNLLHIKTLQVLHNACIILQHNIFLNKPNNTDVLLFLLGLVSLHVLITMGHHKAVHKTTIWQHGSILIGMFTFSHSMLLLSRRMRWAGHVARMGAKRNVYTLLVGKPEGKRPLGRQDT